MQRILLKDFEIFKFDKDKKRYALIRDHEKVIGTLKVHYEIVKRRKKIYVELHFEGNKESKDFFFKNLNSLPDGLEWFEWHGGSQSVRVTGALAINSENIIEELKARLLFLEESIGDKVRNLLSNEELGGNKSEDKSRSKYSGPLNQILYGPPGTGKTYHTILKAAQIIKNDINFSDYTKAKKIFDENLGDRIEFITFHQNYSYEDFIQGLRPDTENDKELTFKKRDGIFKRISDRAKANLLASKQRPEELKRYTAFSKSLNQLKDKVNDSETPIKINETAYIIAAEDDAFRYTGKNWTLGEKGFNGFRMKYTDLLEFHKETITSRQDIKALKNISGLAKQHASYFYLTYKLITDSMPEISGQINTIDENNFVIIIDEINRANISRVFGELITLIEPDKRLDGEIPLRTTLPSGDEFIVPSNLYIIGTMNTADKSIALLDIALRRRFEFVPMYPKYDISEKTMYYKEVLKKINMEIIKAKGYDFQIGHSYFMESNNIKDIMNKKVIPLLLEYFMNSKEDVEKILTAANLEIDKKNPWPIEIAGIKNDKQEN